MEQKVQLEKKLSPVNVWSLALGCIIGWGAFVMPGNTFLVKAGPLGTAIAMAAAALIMCIIANNYHFMINKYPVAGGEFTYTNMAFGERHAFVCSWFLGLSYLAIVPLNATALALIGRNLMNNIFQVGFHYSVAGYDIYLGEIILAEAALLLFAFLSIRGVKFAGIFQTGLVFALVGGVLIVTAAALLNPDVTFSNLHPAFTPGVSGIGGILAVVAVAPWAFVGFDTIPQAAEEFRFSPRKTKSIMVLSIIFGASVYVILNTVTAMVIPEGYATWSDYIADLPNLEGVLSLPTFHAGQQLRRGPRRHSLRYHRILYGDEQTALLHVQGKGPACLVRKAGSPLQDTFQCYPVCPSDRPCRPLLRKDCPGLDRGYVLHRRRDRLWLHLSCGI